MVVWKELINLMPSFLPRFMVILGWIFDKPLPLLFDPFESIVRYHDVLMVLAIFIIHTGFVYLW
jgi:hypothetical protein